MTAAVITYRRPRRVPPRWALAAALAATVGGVSCVSDDTPRRPLPEGSPVVEVAMREYSFNHAQVIPAGHVIFEVRNVGRRVHRLALLPLPEDVPPIREQLKGTARRGIAPFAGIYDRGPGDGGAFAANLIAGRRYAFVCFVVEEDGSHAQKGMGSEFRAGEETSTGQRNS